MPAVTPALALIIFVAGTVAGSLGSLLGIGGGVFLVPFLHLGLNFPITTAAAISLTYNPESRWVKADGSTAERSGTSVVPVNVSDTGVADMDWLEQHGDKAADLLDGNSAAEALSAMVGSGDVPAIEAALRDGSGPRLLVSLGYLVRDEMGIYHKGTRPAPAPSQPQRRSAGDDEIPF